MDAAAKNDEVDTLLELARINDYESGCKPNPEKALRYYKQAAELGSPYARYCLATCYADGFGVPKDDVEAFKWFLKSALQKPPGFSGAQNNLGICYERGLGVSRDLVQAYKWLRLAADGEVEPAKKAATDIAALLSSSQFETAQRLYREFKDSHPLKA